MALSKSVSVSLSMLPSILLRQAPLRLTVRQLGGSLRSNSVSPSLLAAASSSSSSFGPSPRASLMPVAAFSGATPLQMRMASSSASTTPTTTTTAAVSRPKKLVDPTQIVTESQFQIILRKTVKALGDYVDEQNTSTKRLRKIMKRFQLLSQSKFAELLPSEVISFSFFLLSQLIQGRGELTPELQMELHSVFEPTIESRAVDFKPTELARIFWAYGETEMPEEGLVERLCEVVMENSDQYEFHDIVNILIAFQKQSEIAPNTDFVDEMQRQLTVKIADASPSGLAHMICGVCSTGSDPVPELIEAALNKLTEFPDKFVPRQLAIMVYSLAPLNNKPENIKNLQTVIDQMTHRGKELSPRWITRLLGAATVLGLQLPQALVDSCSERLLQTTKHVSPSTISDVFMAYGMSKIPMPSELMASLETQALAKEYKFKGSAIGNLFIGYANLGLPIPADLLEVLERRALLTACKCEPEDILSIFQGLTELQHQPSKEFVNEHVSRTLEILDNPEEDLTILFDVYSKLKDAGGDVDKLSATLKDMTGYDPDLPDDQQPEAVEGETSVVDTPVDEDEQLEKLASEKMLDVNAPNEFEDGWDEAQIDFDFIEVDNPDLENERQQNAASESDQD